MKIITPITMEPYKGWRFITNKDGSFEHIPTVEWVQEMMQKMKDVTDYAAALEHDFRMHKNQNPDGPNDRSIYAAYEMLNG